MSAMQEMGAGLDLRSVVEEDHWISMSDLMAGMMMVFLFIAVALMQNAIGNSAGICDALKKEFADDLPKWDAKICEGTLSVEFTGSKVYFDTGSNAIKPRFKRILDDFFPRYVRVLREFRNSINEVRIEGHASSIWRGFTPDNAYFKNMGLSQDRAREVLKYVYQFEIPENFQTITRGDRNWVKKYAVAVGLSSSHAVKNDDGSENREQSRRVTFRVITNVETQMQKILEN